MSVFLHESYFLSWRDTLDQRLTATVESLSTVHGIVAIVVAGSLGRGEPWPLSDIDIVPIYAEGDETGSGRRVAAKALELEAAWEAEGIRTDVDVGNIWFTDREVREAVARSPGQTVPLLADFRWYHGIDKPYGGRVAWDPTGVAAGFLGWVNRIRYSAEVVSAILAGTGQELSESIDQAARNLRRGDDDEAGVALHRAGYLMVVHLMASEGLRCSSFGRLGTAFERAMAARDRGDTARTVMDVMLLGPNDWKHVSTTRRNTYNDATGCRWRPDTWLGRTSPAHRTNAMCCSPSRRMRFGAAAPLSDVGQVWVATAGRWSPDSRLPAAWQAFYLPEMSEVDEVQR